MARYVFTPTTGDVSLTGQVVLSQSKEIKEIWIATDVQDTLDNDKDSDISHLPGYIGQGFTKIAIYVGAMIQRQHPC